MIGFTVLASAISVGPLFGGAFNPTVAIGNSIGGLFAWANIWVLLIADLAGGAFAGYASKALSPEDAYGR